MLNTNLKRKKKFKSRTNYFVQISKSYMPKVYRHILFLICIFFGQKSFAQISNGDSVFSNDSVHIVRLFFKQPHFWDTLVQRYDTEHSEYDHYGDDSAKPLLASIQIDGKKMDSIGVKLKGNLSNSIPTNKKPLKIYFNSFVKGRTFDGLYRLNLSNEFPDPSMLRNTVAFKILRNAGIMAPRTSFAKVYVNNKYKGLYVMIEQVDKAFFSNYFKVPSGELIKALAGYLYWFPDDTLSFRNNYEIKAKNTPEAWSNLIGLAKKINTTPANEFYDSLKLDFDFNSYITVFAADIIFNNWDSYFYGQNYYIYRDSTEKKYYYLPWDYNISLNKYDETIADYYILPGRENDDLFQLPLPSKIVNNDILKKKYLNEVARINQYMSLDSLENFIRKMHKLIAPALKADSGKVMTMVQYEKSLLDNVAISEFSYKGLLSFIRYRHENINTMLKDIGVIYKQEKKE